MKISDDVQAELFEFWNSNDTTQQGAYHRHLVGSPNSNNQSIADAIANGNAALVWNLKIIRDIILDSTIADKHKPAILTMTRRKVSNLIKNANLSSTANNYLNEVLKILQDKIDFYTPNLLQLQDEVDSSEDLERSMDNIEGCIYVYTLPHYEIYPVKISLYDFIPTMTYYKVGKTERSAGQRVAEQPKTGVPQVPIIKRVYEINKTENEVITYKLKLVESKFHALLTAAGHKYVASSLVGDEWFLTNLDFLDIIAESLSLRIHRPKVEPN